MNVQSWMVKSWPTLEWYLPPGLGVLKTFKHLSSHARDEPSEAGTRQGETVWIGQVMGHDAGLAWEWTEFRPGVVLLTDPNCIVSNIRFTNKQGALLSHPAAIVALNRLVHTLRWQQEVCRVLRADSAQAVQMCVPSPALAWRTEPSTARPYEPGRRLHSRFERAAA